MRIEDGNPPMIKDKERGLRRKPLSQLFKQFVADSLSR